MIKKIYIHIGLPKVASTSIQRSLAKSASFLKQKGILYPVFNINNKTISNHHVFFINRIFKNAENFDFNKNMGLINSKRIEEVNELLFKQFIKQLNSFEGNTLVFSGEFISFFNLQQLNAIKQFLLENINSKAKIEII